MENLEYIDLHIHTNNSDGTFSTQEIIDMAKTLNLKAISITDHDSINGYGKSLYQNGIEVINGVELIVSCNEANVEVLCYGYNYDDMKKFIAKNCLTRAMDCKIKAKRLANNLKKLDINTNFDLNNYDYLDSNKWVFRDFINHLYTIPKAVSVLKEENPDYLNGYKEFFRKGINNTHSKFYVDMTDKYLSIEKLHRFAKENNFLIFLAHPFEYRLNVNEILEYAKNFVDGIEVYHPSADNEGKQFLLDFCNKNNLLISGGSDFHGFRGKLNSQKVPYSALEKIKAKLKKLKEVQ